MGTKYTGKPAEISALNAFIVLNRAMNTLSTNLQRLLDDNNLTSGQFGALEALLHLGPLAQRDLGNKLLSTKGNITMIVDNLEKRKLVKRVPSEDDRRFMIVELTKEGKTLIEKVFPKHVREITELFSVLNQEEKIELKRLCKKLGLQRKN